MITKKSVLYLSALALLLGSCARGTVSSNEVVPKLPKEQANLSEGYYAPDVFNATSPVLRSDSDDGTRYYQYGLTCIRDIRP